MAQSQQSAARALLDVPYVQNAALAQHLDLFLPANDGTKAKKPPLFVFIHGGAWRSGSRAQHHALATYLSRSSEPIAVALIDYRLSVGRGEGVFHPAHLADVFDALRYLLIERETAESGYDARNVVLAGHSVGAGMVSAACFDTTPCADAGRMPVLPPQLRTRIRAWILLDGIYDIPALLDEYPAYNSFVSQAFNAPSGTDYALPLGSHAQTLLSAASLQSWALAKQYAKQPTEDETDTHTAPHIYVLHSRDDTLLTYDQTLRAISHCVRQLRPPSPSTPSSGTLSIPSDCAAGALASAVRQAWERDAALRLPLPRELQVDLELSLDHDAMLQREEFHSYIAEIVRRETGHNY